MIRWIQEVLGVNRAVLALSLARLADGVGNSILFIIIPLYVADLPSPLLDVPDSVLVGVLISLFGFVNSVAQPIMGAWSDHVGRRKAFIQVGLFLMGGSTLAFLLADRYRDLLLIRSLQGVGFALTIPAAMAIMTAVTERRNRGGAMGVFTAFRMVGFAAGPLLGGWLHVAYGFEAAFWTGASFIFASMIAVQLWVHDPPETEAATAGTRFRVFDPDLLNPGILGLGLATFVMAAQIAMMSALENEFNARLSQTALGFGIAFSALTISRLVFQVPLGWLSDRIGRKPLVVVGLVLLAPATALLGYVGTTLQLTEARLFQGLASAAVAAPAFALAGDLSRVGGEGRQFAVLTMGFGLGIATGPLLAGLLAVVSFEAPFVVGGVASLVVAGAVYRMVPETVGGPGTTPGAAPAGDPGTRGAEAFDREGRGA